MTTPARPLGLPDLSLDEYRISAVEGVMTPALAIYPEVVDSNIRATLGLLGGDADRWRPHVKTAKLAFVMRRFLDHGVTNFKCSTTLELATACDMGAADVLVAYPLVNANARRALEIARTFPRTEISALVENQEQIRTWAGSRVGLFIDVNPGMDRTGIGEGRVDEVVGLARAIQSAGLSFRGLHYYDGHLSKHDYAERERAAHRGYDRLMRIVAAFERSAIRVAEVITAGTPAFPCTLSYRPFADAEFIHRASPGTVVYGDCSSLAQLPAEYNYRPAAIVVSTVVSHPAPGRLTCDAGHKTVSADAGVPTCAALGRPDLWPARPSEEHLPIDVAQGSDAPAIGETLYLVPRHVCPTVNNFDHALIVSEGRILGVEPVTARGREAPLVAQ
ncbi:MAG TPA: D-TA family PLP-dependent enzyme [Blastocatellia bacterium]|jgi:D-serine deaminase-like pyridoxal phosphate-dependent protein|nr:D-TA family PLP-dependent enzyme [Blastocatellia bacterium]